MEYPQTLQVNGHDLPVTISTDSDDTVMIHLGDEQNQVTLVGNRYDVHRVVIEMDRQLGRLTDRFRAC